MFVVKYRTRSCYANARYWPTQRKAIVQATGYKKKKIQATIRSTLFVGLALIVKAMALANMTESNMRVVCLIVCTLYLHGH